MVDLDRRKKKRLSRKRNTVWRTLRSRNWVLLLLHAVLRVGKVFLVISVIRLNNYLQVLRLLKLLELLNEVSSWVFLLSFLDLRLKPSIVDWLVALFPDLRNAISQASMKIDSTKPVKLIKEASSQAIHKLGCATTSLAELSLRGFQATQYVESRSPFPSLRWFFSLTSCLIYLHRLSRLHGRSGLSRSLRNLPTCSTPLCLSTIRSAVFCLSLFFDTRSWRYSISSPFANLNTWLDYPLGSTPRSIS